MPIDGNSDLEFFGLTGTGAAPPTPVNPPTTSLPTSTSAPAPGSGAAQWAQCGGIGFAGPTSCISPFRCIKLNDYVSWFGLTLFEVISIDVLTVQPVPVKCTYRTIYMPHEGVQQFPY